jgi:hypothetical protein
MSSLHNSGVAARVNKTHINRNMHYEVIAVSGGQKIRIDASRDQFCDYDDEIIIDRI